MENPITPFEPWLFPIHFVGLWFLVTIILGLLSQWYSLMRKYPDRAEKALFVSRNLSGSMNRVSMNRILTISVCQSGLRFGILRIFGPFCRNFFVPWDQLSIERKDGIMGNTATLFFGEPRIGSLRIPAHVADSLARSAHGNWPEPGPFPEEARSKVFTSIFRAWLIGTVLASLFFTVVPRLAAPNSTNYPPIAVAILFPAVLGGIVSVFRYFHRTKR